MLRQKAIAEKNTVQINSNSDKLLYDKFDTDFSAACQETQIYQSKVSDSFDNN
jgi:hypothetical protein